MLVKLSDNVYVCPGHVTALVRDRDATRVYTGEMWHYVGAPIEAVAAKLKGSGAAVDG